MPPTHLAPHPRLYIGPAEIARLSAPTSHPVLQAAERAVRERAEEFRGSTDFAIDLYAHNGHLIRARRMQTRIVTLLVRYLQTGARRYRDAVMRHVNAMGDWEYWSWIAWRQGDADPGAIFDLSYGENSATLALAYDLLYDVLDTDERASLRALAVTRSLNACLKHTRDAQSRTWWYGHADSNWNAVCAGGAGMLALAMHDELAEARELLPLVEGSFEPYMRRVAELDGGWQEGIGYWNYGMRYAFMYLLSHERAFRRPHALMELPSTRRMLSFPLDFAPHNIAMGFGDCNSWTPLPFHLAAAKRLNDSAVLCELDRRLTQSPVSACDWPGDAELLLLHPRCTAETTAIVEAPAARLYRGLDWAILADRIPDPRLICSIRGGHCAGSHDHRDLLSFNLTVDDEALIVNPASGGYLDTTFSPRRDELYDISPAAKNTILINGVGIEAGSRVVTEMIDLVGVRGVRIDGTEAMGGMRDGRAARFCARLFIIFSDRALLVVDRVETPKTALVESRLHTWGAVKRRGRRARLVGERHSLHACFAASEESVLLEMQDPLTWPVRPSTMLRWCSTSRVSAISAATLLTPSGDGADLHVRQEDEVLTVNLSVGDWEQTLRLDRLLQPVAAAFGERNRDRQGEVL